MSFLVYPVFDPTVDLPSETTGEFLGAWIEAIDDSAERMGLAPLTAFSDSRPIPEDFDGDPDELREFMGPSNEWFDAAEGQRAVNALADALAKRPNDFEIEEEQDEVEAELRDLAQILGEASARGARFRLEWSG